MEKALIIMLVASGVLICLLFIIAIAVGVKRSMADEKAPRITTQVTVKSKRTNTSYHRGGPHNQKVRHTSYYITFSCASGEDLEFKVSADEFGQYDKWETGTLVYKGSRIISFSYMLTHT